MSRLYISPPEIGDAERTAVLAALDSGWIAPCGPQVAAFEHEIALAAGVPYAVALSSGTAGLHLALRVLGVGPGDDVLVSTLTFVATANAVAYLGARPAFVDSDERSWDMDPYLLADELAHRARRGRLPKAVVVVDLYGQCAEYDEILALCREYGVPVVEDAAESLGATYRGRPAGSLGDVAVFSFNGNKIITTSGGGMLVSSRAEWVERARHLASQAKEPYPYYEHVEMGHNYGLSNVLAALGCAQVGRLRARVEHRRHVNQVYREQLAGLDGIGFMPEAGYGRCSFWLTCVRVDPRAAGVDRDDVRLRLEELDIESRPAWKPMHLQPLYAGCPVRGGAVSEDIFARGLCLPSGPGMSDGQVREVAEAVRSTVRQRRAG
ncbi:MAG TPA: aminotransferase class I/II-fold pyridoxal phosphate-dependent enzyme [Mycobacteriales bacterium]|jgi:pyridoxal phosphate-dependent aminotransferase EpsN|nr:aminotransferase class I/II-fold pyridoxal phosphate-dependent enzyme [Mycobacteriales bacterium]